MKLSILINKLTLFINLLTEKTIYFKTCPRWIPLGYVIIWFQCGLYGTTREPNGNISYVQKRFARSDNITIIWRNKAVSINNLI